MGIHLNEGERRESGSNRGFSLIEQLVASALVLIAALCLIQGLAYCLMCLQASEIKWEYNLLEWNESQQEMRERGSQGELETGSGDD